MDIVREVGVASVGDSDVKFDVAGEGPEEERCGAISGELLGGKLIDEASEVRRRRSGRAQRARGG